MCWRDQKKYTGTANKSDYYQNIKPTASGNGGFVRQRRKVETFLYIEKKRLS